MVSDMCETCADWEKRGFEKKPCAVVKCPYKHLGHTDIAEKEAASVRNAMRARGIK
jgi:hypothetical protein